MRSYRPGMLACIALMLSFPALARDAPTPAASSAALRFTGFVVDDAHLLDDAQRQRMTTVLDRLQRRTGHQVAAVTVASLGGQDVARFTLALARRWGVGRRGVDDGVVLLVAPHERQVRLEVGRGLERRLTDARCAAIIAHDILPAFRRGDMAAGMQAGVDAVVRALSAGR